MDLTSYVDNLRQELAVAAEAGGEEAQALVDRLTAPFESAIRLTLLEALSAAADEITRDLAPGSVDLRLRGRDPDFVVTLPPTSQPLEDTPEPGFAPPQSSQPAAPAEVEDGAMLRINLRLPEHLKARVEEAAGRESLSVNAWLVRAASAALETAERPQRPPTRTSTIGQHYTGWVR